MSVLDKEKIKELKIIFTSKSFWGAILFAIALWLYTSLSDTYHTKVMVPLSISLPKDRAVEDEIPDSVTVTAGGSGWDLFTLFAFNSTKNCNINLKNIYINDSTYRISRSQIIKGIENFEEVDARDVDPENIMLKIGKIESKKIDLLAQLDVKPREGFIIVGTPKLKPNTIEVRGNEKLLEEIDKWKTKTLKVDDAYHPIKKKVPLFDSLSTLLSFSEKEVEMNLDVQLSADLTIEDIPIKINGGTLPKKHKILPQQIKVTIQGGVKELQSFDYTSVEASLDYTQIVNDTTGIIKAKIEIPDHLKLIKVEPEYLYHFIQVRKSKLGAY